MEQIMVHLDAGYDSDSTRTLLAGRGLHGRIAHKGEKAPAQASRRWHVERTHAWQNAFHRLARCFERRAVVVDAFFDLADAIITVRGLIRRGVGHPPLPPPLNHRHWHASGRQPRGVPQGRAGRGQRGRHYG